GSGHEDRVAARWDARRQGGCRRGAGDAGALDSEVRWIKQARRRRGDEGRVTNPPIAVGHRTLGALDAKVYPRKIEWVIAHRTEAIQQSHSLQGGGARRARAHLHYLDTTEGA